MAAVPARHEQVEAARDVVDAELREIDLDERFRGHVTATASPSGRMSPSRFLTTLPAARDAGVT